MECKIEKFRHPMVSGDLLKYVNRFRKWSALQQFCKNEQKLTLADFKLLFHLYKRMRNQKRVPDAAYWVEDMLFHHSIVPQDLLTADDVRQWNETLNCFLQLSGNVSIQNEETAQEIIFGWWKSVTEKHFVSGNAFNLMRRSNILTADSWRGVFPKRLLLKNKCYCLLLHCGEVETLVSAGQSGYVINYLNRFDVTKISAKVKDAVYHWAAKVPTDAMIKYLNRANAWVHDVRNYRVFAMHPQGLKCLIKADCFGLIANLALPLKAVAYDYPQDFEGVISQQSYVEMLGQALDEKI